MFSWTTFCDHADSKLVLHGTAVFRKHYDVCVVLRTYCFQVLIMHPHVFLQQLADLFLCVRWLHHLGSAKLRLEVPNSTTADSTLYALRTQVPAAIRIYPLLNTESEPCKKQGDFGFLPFEASLRSLHREKDDELTFPPASTCLPL